MDVKLERSDRIKLILAVAEALQAEDWSASDLTLKEFGFVDGMPDGDRFSGSVHDSLRTGDDKSLIELGNHLSVSPILTAPLAPPAKDESAPLSIFASHKAEHRGLVGSVERKLAIYGIDVFVAHDSIAADEKWQEAIIRHLNTSQMGVAFLHKGFKESDWCAQEVGWLLGRRVPVLSLLYDIAPFGPLGERQGIEAANLDSPGIATRLIAFAQEQNQLRPHLATSLISGLAKSKDHGTTHTLWSLLRVHGDLDASQCRKFMHVIENNKNVATHGANPNDQKLNRPYGELLPEFLERQPGAPAVAGRIRAWRALKPARETTPAPDPRDTPPSGYPDEPPF